MTAFLNSPIGLLLVNGALLGLTLPLGKLAREAGVPPALWAFVISFGAGLVLLAVTYAQGGRFKVTPRKLRYFLITATVSYAVPNMLLFSAIPHLGAGFTGIMYTLSPIVTLMLSLLLGVRKPNALGIAGILVGAAGAVMVAATRGEAGAPADLFWVMIGLLMPCSLAIGNIYRTMDWPPDAGPVELAIGSHLAAAGILLIGLLATDGSAAFAALSAVPLLAVVQVSSSAIMFALFFRLQSVGGPVYLSQIGYVAAAVGLISGLLFLDEHYSILTWAGAVIIVIGVTMTTKAQRKPA
ncbi:DMT family transporter [Oryzicola mucosus]|uniref:DMT family transporter n=1 Tax=Oryzicola mucosus TaxID=2767425 RepID=A0A8J6U431_9HYPH|nr:DMT family transporter [Oryzicola mucosus]MBD0413515.1 DMT family transporter [Oryzicola mucosus]